MSVNVSLSVEVCNGKSFPKLMISNDGLIVLFTSKQVGVAINSNKEWRTGELGRSWDTKDFKDYNGEVTLKN
jgi:hypothetical protein